MNKLPRAAAIAVIALLAPFAGTRAAEFSFRTVDPISAGRSFEVQVLLSARNEDLNAVSGELAFPADLLRADAIRTGGSLVSLWVEPPRIEDGKIIFSGIMPGGFDGRNGQLFSVVFVPKGPGSGELVMSPVSVLLNDGKGTAASAPAAAWPLAVAPAASANAPPPESDIVPPEEFTPVISSTPALWSGAKFLSFVAQDKDSGIDHYEVQEARDPSAPSAWTAVSSPYLLKDQKLRSYIRVRAFDKAGNVRVAELAPTGQPAQYEMSPEWGIMILISAAIIIFLAWSTILRRKK